MTNDSQITHPRKAIVEELARAARHEALAVEASERGLRRARERGRYAIDAHGVAELMLADNQVFGDAPVRPAMADLADTAAVAVRAGLGLLLPETLSSPTSRTKGGP